MDINTAIWGDDTEWIDAAYSGSWDQSLDPKQRIQYAGNTGSYNLHDISGAWSMINTEALDTSLSYCGLGTESPLSHISFYCGSYGYPIGYGGDLNYEQLCKYAISRDDRDITNFAFAKPSGDHTIPRNAQNAVNYNRNSQHQRWLPDSLLGTNTDGYAYNAAVLSRIPVKNIVLIPYVRAFNSLDTNNPNVIYQDLKTYCTTGHTTHPYISSVSVRLSTSSNNSNFEAHTRNDFAWVNGLLIYGDTNMVSEVNADIVSPPEKTGPVTDYFYNYSSEYYDVPIMGKICCSNNVQCKYDTIFTYDDTWDLVGFMGWYNGGSCSVYAWAGEDPLEHWYNVDTGGASGNDSTHYLYWIYDEDFKDKVLSAVACFGLFFVEGASDKDVAFDDPLMMLGILVDGVGHGDYSRGAENRDQAQWVLDDMHEVDYDPENPPGIDPNVYDTPSVLNTPSNCSSGTRYYVLNAAGITNLVGELWKAQESKPSDTTYIDYNNEQYLSNNPVDMIVSCKRYPVTPAKAAAPEALVLGQYETNVQGYRLEDTTSWIYLGSKLVYRHFNNFLDYDTKLTLYVPFCGCIDLDTSVWMGQTILVYMAIDYITGSVTAYLIRDRDKVIYATLEGNCSVDLPITGLQAATIEAQMLNAKSSLDSSKIMMGAKIVGGAAALAISIGSGGTAAPTAPAVIGGITTLASTIADGYKINQQTYDLHHIDATPQQIGSSSPLNAWSGELSCRLYVYYPKLDPNYDAAAYSHSIGNATVSQGLIGSFGDPGQYASFTNADLSGVPCTDTEKTMIINALTSGVYL